MLPFGLTIAEGLGLTSLAYVCAVAAFNAGYFSSVPSRFVELFSFADILNSNIPILQYIIALYLTYIFVTPILYLPKQAIRLGVTKLAEKRTLPRWASDLIDLVLFFIVGGSCLFITYSLDKEQNKLFSLEFIPWAIFYSMILQDFWFRYKRNEIFLRTLLIQAAINATIFCYTTGRMWLKYEIRSPTEIQAMYTQSGCIDRKLLRTTSSGYLLYSHDLKQFEFRDKSEIKTIYSSKGCT